jgi:hypothetical protein
LQAAVVGKRAGAGPQQEPGKMSDEWLEAHSCILAPPRTSPAI